MKFSFFSLQFLFAIIPLVASSLLEEVQLESYVDYPPPVERFSHLFEYLTIPCYLEKVDSLIKAAAYFGILIYSSCNHWHGREIDYDLLKRKIDESKKQNDYFEAFVFKDSIKKIIELRSLGDFLFGEKLEDDIYFPIFKDTFHLFMVLNSQDASFVITGKLLIGPLSLTIISELVPMIGEELTKLLENPRFNKESEFTDGAELFAILTDGAKLFAILNNFQSFYQKSFDKDKIVRALLSEKDRGPYLKTFEALAAAPTYRTCSTIRKLTIQAEVAKFPRRILHSSIQKQIPSSSDSSPCPPCTSSYELLYHYPHENVTENDRQIMIRKIEFLGKFFRKNESFAKYLMAKHDIGLASVKSIDQAEIRTWKILAGCIFIAIVIGVTIAFVVP